MLKKKWDTARNEEQADSSNLGRQGVSFKELKLYQQDGT